MPDRIKEAVKGGDPKAIADAVRGLSGDNGGINAKRRQQEASIIEGGKGYDALDPPDYMQFIPPDERLRLTTAAEGEVTSRKNQADAASALDKYKTETSINNDLAQIETTGKVTDLSPDQVQSVLGDAGTAKWLNDRSAAVATYKAVSVMPAMTEADMNKHVHSGQLSKLCDDRERIPNAAGDSRR